MVEAEEAQTNELRSDDRSDYWQGLSALFKQDPRRTDDPDVDVLSRFVNADSTVIDVGAGAGRVALPLALKCRKVVAVEPSVAMCKDLNELKAEYGIGNVEVVEATWEDASVEPADLAFAAHVIYTVKNIAGFIDKLTKSARRIAAVIIWIRAPLYSLNPLWADVYGIERLNLPSFPELLEVLWEMGIEPQVELGPARPQRGWPDKESAFQMLRHRLFIGDSRSELLDSLRDSIARRMVQREDGWMLGEAPLRGPVLVHWLGSA
jgi:FkbM family methyltransferase